MGIKTIITYDNLFWAICFLISDKVAPFAGKDEEELMVSDLMEYLEAYPKGAIELEMTNLRGGING